MPLHINHRIPFDPERESTSHVRLKGDFIALIYSAAAPLSLSFSPGAQTNGLDFQRQTVQTTNAITSAQAQALLQQVMSVCLAH